jgi:hypothetical protein
MSEDGKPATIERRVYNHQQQFVNVNIVTPLMTNCPKSWVTLLDMLSALFKGCSEDRSDVVGHGSKL